MSRLKDFDLFIAYVLEQYENEQAIYTVSEEKENTGGTRWSVLVYDKEMSRQRADSYKRVPLNHRLVLSLLNPEQSLSWGCETYVHLVDELVNTLNQDNAHAAYRLVLLKQHLLTDALLAKRCLASTCNKELFSGEVERRLKAEGIVSNELDEGWIHSAQSGLFHEWLPSTFLQSAEEVMVRNGQLNPLEKSTYKVLYDTPRSLLEVYSSLKLKGETLISDSDALFLVDLLEGKPIRQSMGWLSPVKLG